MKLLHRFRFVLLAIVGAALIVATVVTQRGGEQDADPTLGHLGPTPGPVTSDAYIAAKRTYLERMAKATPSEEVAALISLKSYLPAPGVQAMVRGTSPLAVFVRMPASEGESLPVTTTLAGVVADRATDLRKEIQAEIDGIDAGEPGGAALIAEREAALAKVKSDCGCVFAVAVEGATFAELAALAKHAEVRLVDVPDPPEQSLRGWELGPLVPKSK